MLLCIMTRGRVGRQETLKHIPKKWLPNTVLISTPGEVHSHQYIPVPTKNYSEKFQWLYDGRILPGHEKIVIMDDDLYFNRYEIRDGKRKLCVIKDPELNQPMFDLMEYMLDKIALVGVHPRMMANNATEPFEWNSKIVTIQGINRTLAPKDLKLDHDPILADVWLNCHLLARGIATARITTHFVDWLPSQASGGCDYRTAEMQRVATERIAKAFGPYAHQVIKRPKTAKWLGDERYDLGVRWKDLYRDRPLATPVLDSRTGEGS